MPHSETTLSSKELFTGRVVRLTLDTVELENGDTSTREVVHHPGGACVMAITPEEEIYMVKQFRYAFGRELWELPAGKLEYGEDPFEAAKRELAEECGVTAEEFTFLCDVYPTVGYCTEVIHTWLARGLHATAQHLDADEFLDVHKVPFEKALHMVMTGEICDSKTMAGILKYAQMRGEG